VNEPRPFPSPRRPRHAAMLSAALLALAIGSTSAFSQQNLGEPFNNAWPTSFPGKVIFQHAYTSNTTPNWQIAPAGDVDYHVLACDQVTADGPPRFVGEVRMAPAAGNLDIEVYHPSLSGPRLIGRSANLTGLERLVIGGQFTSVFLKVYGPRNATGGYATSFDCR